MCTGGSRHYSSATAVLRVSSDLIGSTPGPRNHPSRYRVSLSEELELPSSAWELGQKNRGTGEQGKGEGLLILLLLRPRKLTVPSALFYTYVQVRLAVHLVPGDIFQERV